MAAPSLTECDIVFNQLSSSSARSCAVSCRSSLYLAKLKIEQVTGFLVQAKTVSDRTLNEMLQKDSPPEHHYYLAVLNELIEAATTQLDEVMPLIRPVKKQK